MHSAKSSFNLPSLDTESLSNIISSMSSSLTSTKTEMTDLATGQARVVRLDVRSERKGAIDDLHPTDEWRLYKGKSESVFVRRIWSWSYKKDDFIYLRDPRCLFCYKESTNPFGVPWCAHCESAFICFQCVQKLHQHIKSKECHYLLKEYRSEKMATVTVPSFSVAMKETIFGEGAERIVRKFRFMDENGHFIGPKMVAKESRFIDAAEGSYKETRSFHSNFMRTQVLASEFATKFNQALDCLRDHFDDFQAIDNLPRIEFVEPMVVEVNEHGEKSNILIERFLEGKYEKFNSNMGFVKGQTTKDSFCENVDQIADAFNDLPLDNLGVIEEESEEEDSDDELFDQKAYESAAGKYRLLKPEMFLQTFSHYSFEKSKRKYLVIDLQGVYEKKRDGTQKYVLTDPAIHKKKRTRRKRYNFGRTDMGKKGMRAFFETHECTDACRLLGLQKVDPKIFDEKMCNRSTRRFLMERCNHHGLGVDGS